MYCKSSEELHELMARLNQSVSVSDKAVNPKEAFTAPAVIRALTEKLASLNLELAKLEVKRCEIINMLASHGWVVSASGIVELKTELEKADRDPERSFIERVLDFWTPERFMDVMTGIGDMQRRMLLAVYQQPNITGRDLSSALGVGSEFALAGVVSGLSKQLRPLGIELGQVLLVNVRWGTKTKTRRFMLEDFFVSAGAEQGWPDRWGGNPKTTTTRSKRAVKKSRATKTVKSGEAAQ